MARRTRRRGKRMKRRQLIFLFGGSILTMPFVTRAGQSNRTHLIGVLAQDLQPGLLDAFRAGLHDFGYDAGKNISLQIRNAEGRTERLAEMAAELVRLKVDVILAVNTPAAKAAAKATTTTPIIIMRVADPVKA